MSGWRRSPRSRLADRRVWPPQRCLRSSAARRFRSSCTRLRSSRSTVSPRESCRQHGECNRHVRDQITGLRIDRATGQETRLPDQTHLLKDTRPDDDTSVRVNDAADARIRGAREVAALLDGAHRGHLPVLIRRRRPAIPAVVGDRRQQLAACRDRIAGQRREDDLVTDGRADAMRADRQHDRALARRKRHEPLDERCGKGNPSLEGKELAEWNELDLAIDRDGLAVGVKLKGRVVEFGSRDRLTPDGLIAAEQNRDANLTRKVSQHRVALGIVTWILEGERRGRFGPDDVLRTAAYSVAGHGEVGREDAPRVGGIPLVFLRDVALNQSDAYRRPLSRE